jgi:hypothetical protein
MKTDKTKKEDLDKMDKMKKKWAGMYVNKMAHFGCQSTNRVEGGHATMKSILSNASGSLQKAFESIHKWYTGMVGCQGNEQMTDTKKINITNSQ